jgi:uncharacterized protein (TIGR03118 family)
MKFPMATKVFSFLLAGFVLAAASAAAQNIAYRQTNLASDVPGFANHINPFLRNSWGIAFQTGLPFFIANANNGRVAAQDATGSSIAPDEFAVQNPAGSGPGAPTGIVADPSSFFGSRPGQSFIIANITATEDGGIYFWGVDANGNIPQQATLVVDHSQLGAVYTGVAILKPDCCSQFLAVANFHSSLIEPYTQLFDPLAPPGSFTDPNLPPGFGPFGMQVIGNQVFVTYAVQDAAKQNPVAGAGNGIVNVFDLEGNFLRRFATSGTLNAPWGITQASANFGPFSNDILIGNVGDGLINAFDPVTGNFAGQIKDGDGNPIVNAGLHALTFRSDGFGDSDTLYFTAGIANNQDGLFGTITPGLVSTTSVSVPPTPANTAAPFTVTVSAGPGNPGTPTGQVTLQDGGVPIADVSLTNGVIVFPETLTGVGIHVIKGKYLGDATFLPSSSRTEAQVTGLPTALTLLAPATAIPGSPLTLTATLSSAGGVPTGQIVFHDGNTNLGTAPLDAAAVAILRTDTLSAGAHSLTASYSGDDKFAGSTSAPVITTIANKDFSLDATPSAATLTAGQSAMFSITVTPAGGFADPVAFSCPLIAGITCNFTPPTVTPNGGVAATLLTVTTSANLSLHGQTSGGTGFGLGIAGLGLFGVLASLKQRRPRGAIIRMAAGAIAVVTLALALVSCGGSATTGQTTRGAASIVVTAQSGVISRTTTISVTMP